MRQFSTVRAGMSEPEVEIIMGAPDYARCDVSKQGDKFLGSAWQYAVVVSQDPEDSQNSVISMTFGQDGKLSDKSAVNMQPKPSPTPTPVAAASPSPSTTPAQDATPQPTPTATPVVVPSATPASVPSATATPSPMQ